MDANLLKQKYEDGDRNFAGADLSGADLSWLVLDEARFDDADLYAAQFRSAQLVNTNFRQANLSFACLDSADLTSGNLCGANLEGASLSNTHFDQAIYDDETRFPIGFDAIAAGMIHCHEQEQAQAAEYQAQHRTIADRHSAPPSEPALNLEPSPNPTFLTADATATDWTDAAVQPQTAAFSATETHHNRAAQVIGLATGLSLLLLGGYAVSHLNETSLFQALQKKGDGNPFAAVSFPQAACGDPAPTESSHYPVSFYPVFVDYSAENVAIIQSRYCQDAYPIQRQGTGQQVVQVASFTSRDRADAFAAFMVQNVGSGEVGSPHWVGSLAELSQ